MIGRIISVTVILLTFNLLGADSLKCHQCTSLNNTACGDPFDAHETLEECPAIATREAILCRKLRQTFDTPNGKMIRVTRSCGYIPNPEPEKDVNCFRASFTAAASSRYCACTEDACNSSYTIRGISMLIGLFVVAVYLIN